MIPIVLPSPLGTNNQKLENKLLEITRISIDSFFHPKSIILDRLESLPKLIVENNLAKDHRTVLLAFAGTMLMDFGMIKNQMDLQFKNENIGMMAPLIYHPHENIAPWIWPQVIILKIEYAMDSDFCQSFLKKDVDLKSIHIASKENIHDDYTPIEITSKTVSGEFKSSLGSFWIQKILNQGQRVVNFSPNFRQFRYYAYRKGQPTALLQFLESPSLDQINESPQREYEGLESFKKTYFNFISSKNVYPLNTNLRDIDFKNLQQESIEKFNHISLPVSGVFGEFLYGIFLKKTKIHLDQITFFDYFDESLAIKEKIYQQRITSLDQYIEAFLDIYNQLPKSKTVACVGKKNIEKMNYCREQCVREFNALGVDFGEIFQITSKLTKKYVKIDLLNNLDYSLFKQHNHQNWIYFSNIFEYLKNQILHGNAQMNYKKQKFIENCYKHNIIILNKHDE